MRSEQDESVLSGFSPRMVSSPSLRDETRLFMRFCAVGGGGFVIDAGILAILVHVFGFPPLGSRVVSAAIAILATFAMNYYWAFDRAGGVSVIKALASYISVQGVGFACNFAIYTLCVTQLPAPFNGPMLGITVASAVALAVNYLGARLFTFRQTDDDRSGETTGGGLRAFLFVLVGTAILLWPAVVNKTPFLFYDTSHYLEIGKSIASRIPVLKTLAVQTEVIPGAGQSVPATSDVTADDGSRDHPSLSYAGGRSAYYSVFVYVLARISGLWGIAVVQTLVAAWLLWRLAAMLDEPKPERTYLMLVLPLALLTALPFYVTMAMPDVFAGLGLLALALLLFSKPSGDRANVIALTLVVAWSAASHTSTLALTLVVLVLALAIGALAFRLDWRRLGSLAARGAAPLVLAALALMAFSTVTKVLLGAAPKSPPYIMARVLADGSGRAYLKDACVNPAAFTLCQFENRRFATQDEFLWSGDPQIGVFSLVDYATRNRLQAEEMAFTVAAVSHYPVMQLKASVAHFLRQLVTFGVALEFGSAAQSWDTMSFGNTIPELEASYKNGLAYRGRFAFDALDRIQIATVLLSLLFVVWRLSARDIREALMSRGKDVRTTLAVCAAVLLLALLANAALCGIASGVNDRYQARIVWLLPLLAMVILVRLGLRPKRPVEI